MRALFYIQESNYGNLRDLFPATHPWMIKIANKPALEYLLDFAILNGCTEMRFIMEEPSGRTLLVAHNIDIAPRVERLFEGGKIRVFGEYEPNDLGGIIHWTHHDPEQRIEGGWIEFRRKRYA